MIQPVTPEKLRALAKMLDSLAVGKFADLKPAADHMRESAQYLEDAVQHLGAAAAIIKGRL